MGHPARARRRNAPPVHSNECAEPFRYLPGAADCCGAIGVVAADCGESGVEKADGAAAAAAGSGVSSASSAAVAPPTMRMLAASNACLMRQRSSRSTVTDLPGMVLAET